MSDQSRPNHTPFFLNFSPRRGLTVLRIENLPIEFLLLRRSESVRRTYAESTQYLSPRGYPSTLKCYLHKSHSALSTRYSVSCNISCDHDPTYRVDRLCRMPTHKKSLQFTSIRQTLTLWTWSHHPRKRLASLWNSLLNLMRRWFALNLASIAPFRRWIQQVYIPTLEERTTPSKGPIGHWNRYFQRR